MALNEFVQTALDEEGYEEGSDGYTKYGSWYGLANADWCVMGKCQEMCSRETPKI